MNAQLAPEDSDTEATPEGARALLRSVVITDLCDSTALVDRLGDVRATELIRAHDRLLRGLIREHRGQEIDKTDGFLSLFERPIQAVAFALAYQRGLRAFSLEHGVEVSARIGLHVGEVMTWQNEDADVAKGAKPTEVEGLAKPVAARLMGMALPGQILLSSVAYTLAHRAEGELGAALSRVQWKAHGDFRFKGVAEAVPVYEIGEQGIAPFKAPAWSGKAHREVPLWRRPAMLAFEVIALVVAVALPAWHFLKPEPAIAFAERDWVVLADLRNLTGDPRFDDSLEQAFRIGLEQSRHVNVLSDLQVRDTLQRMQRDSDSPVDRSIGAEIAMREGARALVLPTLAEVGGRLRFTAEVIHPNTQATVYSEYADGRGAEAVLPLVDEVNRKLRERLGEAVAQVEADSQPLEKVATADMDALRAYSRALALLDSEGIEDGRALLRRAIEIDPTFARAHLELGVTYVGPAERHAAAEHFEYALKHHTRLGERERKYAEAMLQSMHSRDGNTLDLWRTLHLTYPDYFAASGAYAWFLWTTENSYSDAIDVLRANVNERNPRRGTGLYMRAALHIGLGQLEIAERWLASAEELGIVFEGRLAATVAAIKRDFDGANSLLRGNEGGNSESAATRVIASAAFLADQGDIKEAQKTLEQALITAAPAPQQRSTLTVALLAMEYGNPTEKLLTPTRLSGARDEWRREDSLSEEALAEAWIFSRAKMLDERDEIRLRTMNQPTGKEARQRLELILAQQALNRGQATIALDRLDAIMDGSHLIVTQQLALETAAAAGNWEKVVSLASALVELRGKAYVEPALIDVFHPLNVYWASTARLHLANGRLQLGDEQGARTELTRFKHDVQRWESNPKLKAKVDELETALRPIQRNPTLS